MQRLPRELTLCVVIAFGAAITGCTSFSDLGSVDPPAGPGDTSSRDVALASYNEPAGASKPGSPLSLSDFSPDNFGTTVKQLSGKGPDREVAQGLYDEAEAMYHSAVASRQREPLTDVSSDFLQAADKYQGAAARWPDSALEEDALFRAGECQFFADQYVKANDTFESLLKKYPNSRYLDLVGARRFVIAKYWIDLDNADHPPVFGLNLTDKQRPWSDTHGHAIRIFDRMRLDDPTGKLADDATIAAANALFARGDYEGADQYYTDLRLHFPSSEHQFMAHYLGIQAKLRGYRGPAFAGDALDEAEKLIKQVRRQFPTETRQHEEELAKAYREVRHRKAEREWTMAKYYAKRNQFGAARFYYDLILEDYSDTAYAEQAEQEVMAIAGKPRNPPQRLSWLVDLFPDGKPSVPVIATAPEETLRR